MHWECQNLRDDCLVDCCLICRHLGAQTQTSPRGNGPQNRVFPRSVGAFWHCGHFVGVSSVAKFLRVMGFRPYFFLALWLDTWALVIVPSALWAVWWHVKVQVLLPRL